MMMTILVDNDDDIGQVHWLYLVTIMMMISADNDDDIGQFGVR